MTSNKIEVIQFHIMADGFENKTEQETSKKTSKKQTNTLPQPHHILQTEFH